VLAVWLLHQRLWIIEQLLLTKRRLLRLGIVIVGAIDVAIVGSVCVLDGTMAIAIVIIAIVNIAIDLTAIVITAIIVPITNVVIIV
jgi:hypothetical protein